MEKIVIDIKNIDEYNRLVEFGSKCDVDFEHVPFSRFWILLREDRNALIAEAERFVKMEQMTKYPFMNSKEQKRYINDMMKIILKKLPEHGIKQRVEIVDNTLLFNDDTVISGFPVGIFNSETLHDHDVEISYPRGYEYGSVDEADKLKYARLVFGILATFQATKTPIPRKTEYKPRSNKPKQASKKKSNKRVQYVKNTVYSLSLTDVIEANTSDEPHEKGKYQYHVSSWYQRGHWRTYKSGKRVWVHACFKSPKKKGDTEIKEKYYRLGVEENGN